MKLKSTIALTLLALATLAEDDGWESLSSGTTENLNAVHFTSTSVGYVVGNNGVGLKTSNGSSWSSMTMSTVSNIKDIFFTDANNGFATDQSGNLLSTNNAGSSWSSKNIQAGGINAVHINGNSGVLAGDNGYLFISADGGSQWTSKGSQSVFALNDVCSLNDSTFVVVGSGGTALKSIDKGNTWSSLNLGTSDALSSVAMVNDSSAIVVGTNGMVISVNVFTGDYEQKAFGLSSQWLTGVDCLEGSCKSIGSQGTSLLENEANWIDRSLDDLVNFNDVEIASGSTLYAVGIGGSIYRSDLAGFKVNLAGPNGNEDITISPNPVVNSISITGIRGSSLVEILNLQGQVVKQLQIGSNTISDLSNLTAGQYLLRVTTEHTMVTKKFFKL